MDQKLIAFNKATQRKDLPEINTGDVVRVHKKIKEGEKERTQVFKGLVIAVKGRQSSSPTITVRRESQGIGAEFIFPVNLPTIEKIEVLRHSKIRRAKLYYMRERSGKSAKMKVKDLSEKEKAEFEVINKNKKGEKEDESEKSKPELNGKNTKENNNDSQEKTDSSQPK